MRGKEGHSVGAGDKMAFYGGQLLASVFGSSGEAVKQV